MHTPEPHGAMKRKPLLPLFLLSLLFLVLTVPVILSGRGGSSETSDQDDHHLVVIKQFEAQWPAIDIVQYPSATSPGYHAAMAAIGVAVGPPRDLLVMRLLNCLLGLGFVVACWWAAQWYVSRWAAFALTLPLVMSSYVLGSSIWLTTDTAALFFVLLAMTAVLAPRSTRVRFIGCGIAAAVAVGIRQIHVWTVAPVGFAGILASPLGMKLPRFVRVESAEGSSWGALVAGMLGAMLPAGVLAWLVWQWGGLMPPIYADMHNAGENYATFAFALAMFGVFGVWYLPLIVKDCKEALRDRLLWIGVGLGALSAVVVPTSYVEKQRAYGALWRVVEMLPAVGERSIVLLPAAAIGGGVLVLLYRGAQRAGQGPRAAVVLLCVLGWVGAQSMNSMAWQRYFEPMTLVWLAWLVALGVPEGSKLGKRWLGVGVVVGVLFLLSAASLYREVITGG